jgi:hypothetical protein
VAIGEAVTGNQVCLHGKLLSLGKFSMWLYRVLSPELDEDRESFLSNLLIYSLKKCFSHEQMDFLLTFQFIIIRPMPESHF